MSAKHTPGPWTVEDSGALIAVRDSQERLALVVRAIANGRDEAAANARLMAAAPVMLDALEWVVGPADECEKCRRIGSPCIGHAAIAKARGEVRHG